MNKKTKTKKPGNKKPGYRQIFLIICALFWSIYPFITRVVVKKIPEIEASFFSNKNGQIIDLFLFPKEIVLAVFSGAVILYFLGERIFPDKIIKLDRNRIKNLKLPFICIGVYIVFSVLSFVLSDYKETAFWGANSEYEGLLAILCYAVIFIFAVIFLKKETDTKVSLSAEKIFQKAVVALSLITAVLTLIEIFYKPLLEIPIVQTLISSEENRKIAEGIKNENFIGQICLTFHNPGFLGGFCALILPVLYSVILQRKGIRKWLYSAAGGILILAVKWSDSKVAMVALAVTLLIEAVIVFLLLGRKKLGGTENGESSNPDYTRRKKTESIISFGAIVVIGILLIVLSKIVPTYSSRTNETENASEAEVTEKAGEDGITETASLDDEQGLYRLSKAEIDNGVLKLFSDEKCLEVSVDDEILQECYRVYGEKDFADALIFTDGTAKLEEKVPTILKKTNIREEVSGFRFTDERFKDIRISVDKELAIFDFGYMGTVEFYITYEGLKPFGQGGTLLDEIPQPAVTGLEGIYSFATGRGYIWAQALPILKNSLIVGGGNGTFAFRFRQNEMVGLMNTHGSCKYVIDRPHNWYLQIACSDGVPALIAVLVLFIYYIVGILKNIRKTLRESITEGTVGFEFIDIGLFAGLIGFMLCGFINDSCVTVNPLFWLFLGWAVARMHGSKSESK